MYSNVIFQRFVDGCDSQAAAARKLDCSRATVNRVYHGHMPVSLRVARRIEELSDGKFAASAMLGLRPVLGDMREEALHGRTP